MILTMAELTVLGLIVEQPRHGYDLEQVIEQRGMRAWTDIAFSSIYYVLARLEKRGFVDAEQGRSGSKSRRVFRATAEGRHAATSGALSSVAVLRSVPHPALIGLANLPLFSDQDYVAALGSRLTQIEARIASVIATERQQAPLPLSAREVFSYSLNLLEAERAWLAKRVPVSNE